MRRYAWLVLLGFFGCQKSTPSRELANTPTEAVNKPAPAERVVATLVAAPTLLAIGADVPWVTTVAHDGTAVDFKRYAGKPFAVYFYPKDFTGG